MPMSLALLTLKKVCIFLTYFSGFVKRAYLMNFTHEVGSVDFCCYLDSNLAERVQHDRGLCQTTV